MVIRISPADESSKDTLVWWKGKDGNVWIRCSNGHVVMLEIISVEKGRIPLHHVNSETGEITPSVVCPRTRCGFHDHLILEGWKR